MIKIEIWASGSGTNAEKLVEYFRNHPKINIQRIVSNIPNAGVLERAKRLNIEHEAIDSSAMRDGSYLKQLIDNQIDYIVLAGYLSLVPASIVKHFENKIFNIHPALLPKYGGKGMYGNNVHRAVLAARETISGVSIHLVNEEFDKGRLLAQFTVAIDKGDSIDSLLPRIHRLEHKYYALVIEDYILNQ
jgi:phosphoribosylglycinamide formyltransferase-1